jgi:hypothetical protein
MCIEPGKVREFARAVGSSHPEHLEGVTPVSPVTFLQASAFWRSPANEALPKARDLRRVLHASQEFVFPHGPPRAGTILTGRQRIEREWTKEGRRGGRLDFVLVITDYTDEHGALVAQVRSTTVSTARPADAS